MLFICDKLLTTLPKQPRNPPGKQVHMLYLFGANTICIHRGLQLSREDRLRCSA